MCERPPTDIANELLLPQVQDSAQRLIRQGEVERV